MRVWPVVFGFAVLFGVLPPGRGGAAEAVLSDPESGCRIRDPEPAPGKRFRWTGECRGGFADGGGVLEWTLHDRPAGWAEGSLVAGRLEGEARVEWADGRVFTGTYRQGLASGYGTLAFPGGHRYVGLFAHGRPTGEGEFVSAMGLRYGAEIDESGGVWPGAMLGPQAAEAAEPAPSVRKPSVPERTRREAARNRPPPRRPPVPVQSAERPKPSLEEPAPGSLDEWLR